MNRTSTFVNDPWGSRLTQREFYVQGEQPAPIRVIHPREPRKGRPTRVELDRAVMAVQYSCPLASCPWGDHRVVWPAGTVARVDVRHGHREIVVGLHPTLEETAAELQALIDKRARWLWSEVA